MSPSDADYIVVGGGAAGAVLAARLSETPQAQVVLLEAGPDTPPGEEPADILDSYPIVAYFNRRYHWQNIRVDLNTLDSGRNRRYEQARVMGGGTSINGMFAVRGLPWDFDGWAAAGADGWDWVGVLPYFRKLERDIEYGDDPAHGDAGPLPLRRIPVADWSPFTAATARALDAMGVPFLPDHNAAFGNGYFPMAINNVDGERVSTARAYLTHAVRRRPNLTIRFHSEVVGLLFEGTRAVGVRARTPAGETTLRGGEVIICAGALQSPALLMRAGIGPAEHLRQHGIAVRADRPGVGRNLQDHPMVALAACLPAAARLPSGMRRHIQMGYRYTSGLPETTAGDMFVLPSNRAAWHPLGRRLASILVCVNRPYSTGAVTLAGPQPEQGPIVRFNLLDDPRDLERLAAGMHHLWDIITHPAMRGIVSDVFPATFSDRVRKLGMVSRRNWAITAVAAGLMATGPLSRRLLIRHVITPGLDTRRLLAAPADLRAWIRENTCGSWHASGTCRLGRADDPAAVVDPAARVLGVANLRVVDASIMPAVVSANTMLTTVMAAEKVADAIKAEARATTPVPEVARRA